jgi:hypothetical protein
MDDGRVPVIWLSCMLIALKSVNCPKPVGSGPVSEFFCRDRNFSALRLFQLVGMLPVKALPCRFRLVREVKAPIQSGREPVIGVSHWLAMDRDLSLVSVLMPAGAVPKRLPSSSKILYSVASRYKGHRKAQTCLGPASSSIATATGESQRRRG